MGESYAGGWLASLERVVVRPEDGSPIDTGWVILVQAGGIPAAPVA